MCDERFDRASLGQLREKVACCVTAAGMPGDRTDDVKLAVHELAANVITHGPGSGRLVICTEGGALACKVTDSGPGSLNWPVERGHGLWMVQELADQFAVDSRPDDGSHVTAWFSYSAA